ncbi:MAG: GNAT family N-acetyltransferase [Clostridia bacterium]|nr:GNAT family N-acetyltransferase [Clostridia bacterium]
METNIIISDNKDYQTKIFDNITNFNNKKNPNMIGTNAWNFGELFGFYVTKDEEIIGGIVVYEKMQWIQVDTLFVDEKYRNKKLGSQLIAKLIEYCKSNNLIGIHLTTLDFQAKGFYEKQNFTLIAEIKDWPKGITRYEFIKYI